LPLKLTFSEHGRIKLEQRNLSEAMLTKVLQNPEARFYDTSSRAQIAVGDITQQGVGSKLVVVFRRKGVDTYHIVTAYPVIDLESEVRRKVNVGRWIPTSTGAVH